MKAVVMYPGATAPVLTDRPDPVVVGTDALMLRVKAVAIKNLDIGKATGKHYSSNISSEGQILGMDGIGLTEQGKRVYGISREGILSEYSLVDRHFITPVPDDLDDMTAAAIPNAIMGSAMALQFRAGFKKGETVLINGATGVTGMMAIQVARYYGAGRIVVTGRREETWPLLQRLGANEWITLGEDKYTLSERIRQLHHEYPTDVVLDYLWGESALAILAALKGNGDFSHPVRYVSIGGMTADSIELSSSVLRSTRLQLVGSGLGSWSREEVGMLFKEILPVFYRLAAEKRLTIHTKSYSLDQINDLWTTTLPSGTRAVIEL